MTATDVLMFDSDLIHVGKAHIVDPSSAGFPVAVTVTNGGDLDILRVVPVVVVEDNQQ